MPQQCEHHGHPEADQPQTADKGNEVIAVKSHLFQLKAFEETVELSLLLLTQQELQRMLPALLKGVNDDTMSKTAPLVKFIYKTVPSFQSHRLSRLKYAT